MNPLLEKEVEAFREVLVSHGESCTHTDMDECLNRDVDYFTQALERVWKEGAKVGAQSENGMWMEGMRCTNCGGNKNPDGLSDMCGKCFEEA